MVREEYAKGQLKEARKGLDQLQNGVLGLEMETGMEMEMEMRRGKKEGKRDKRSQLEGGVGMESGCSMPTLGMYLLSTVYGLRWKALIKVGGK